MATCKYKGDPLKNGTVSKVSTGVYVALGMVYMTLLKDVPQWYLAILLFIGFKVVFRYEKCTVSYIEIKLRGVKKEEGYLYNFLAGFQKLRDSDLVFYSLLGYVALVTLVYFCALGKTMLI